MGAKRGATILEHTGRRATLVHRPEITPFPSAIHVQYGCDRNIRAVSIEPVDSDIRRPRDHEVSTEYPFTVGGREEQLRRASVRAATCIELRTDDLPPDTYGRAGVLPSSM